jgi:hypothetical protein
MQQMVKKLSGITYKWKKFVCNLHYTLSSLKKYYICFLSVLCVAL